MVVETSTFFCLSFEFILKHLSYILIDVEQQSLPIKHESWKVWRSLFAWLLGSSWLRFRSSKLIWASKKHSWLVVTKCKDKVNLIILSMSLKSCWADFLERLRKVWRHTQRIAKRVSDVITQTNSAKQNGIVEELTLFQARKQVFLKQFFKRKFGVQFPLISPRTRLCCLTLAGFQ